MTLFLSIQKSPPADHDLTAEITRMIVDAPDEATAMSLFGKFAQPGHTIELLRELPDQAWVEEQAKAGKLKPGTVMNYSAPLK